MRGLPAACGALAVLTSVLAAQDLVMPLELGASVNGEFPSEHSLNNEESPGSQAGLGFTWSTGAEPLEGGINKNMVGPPVSVPGYKASHDWVADYDEFSPLVFHLDYYRAMSGSVYSWDDSTTEATIRQQWKDNLDDEARTTPDCDVGSMTFDLNKYAEGQSAATRYSCTTAGQSAPSCGCLLKQYVTIGVFEGGTAGQTMQSLLAPSGPPAYLQFPYQFEPAKGLSLGKLNNPQKTRSYNFWYKPAKLGESDEHKRTVFQYGAADTYAPHSPGVFQLARGSLEEMAREEASSNGNIPEGSVVWTVETQPADNVYCEDSDRTTLGTTDASGTIFTAESCKAFCENELQCVYAVYQPPPDTGECHWQKTCSSKISRDGDTWTWKISRPTFEWDVVLQPSDDQYCDPSDRTSLGSTDSAGNAYTPETCKEECASRPNCLYAVFQDQSDSGANQCHWQITCASTNPRAGSIWTWKKMQLKGETNPAHYLQFVSSQSNAVEFGCIPANPLNLNEWVFISVTMGVNSIKVYYDAVEVCTATNDQGHCAAQPTDCEAV
jgi:hypothetical protein